MVVQGHNRKQQFSSAHHGDVRSVMAPLALFLQSLGLFIEWKSWSISWDSQGIVLRMPWAQHYNSRQGAVESGHPDTGPRPDAPRKKKKSPSKARRDRARWETHQASKASSNAQGTEDAARKEERISVARKATVGRRTHIDRETVDHNVAEQSAEVCDDQRSSAVGPATVNVITPLLNVNAREFQPRNTKNNDKEQSQSRNYSLCKQSDSSKVDLSDINIKLVHSVSTSTKEVAYCDVAMVTVAVDTATSSSQCEASDISLKLVHTVSTSTDTVVYNDVAIATNVITTSDNSSQSESVDYISNAMHMDFMKMANLTSEVECLTSRNTQLTTMNEIWKDMLDKKGDKIEELESKSMKEMHEIKEQLTI